MNTCKYERMRFYILPPAFMLHWYVHVSPLIHQVTTRVQTPFSQDPGFLCDQMPKSCICSWERLEIMMLGSLQAGEITRSGNLLQQLPNAMQAPAHFLGSRRCSWMVLWLYAQRV